MQSLPPQTPGVYPGAGQAGLLRSNCQQWLFQKNLVVAGQASIACQLERIRGEYYPFGASMQVSFTDVNGVAASPGTFEVDFQCSDVDADAAYYTILSLAGAATVLNTSFQGGIQVPNFWAKYVRALVKTLPNAVYTSILLTR